ncbi:MULTISPECIES: dihydrolipoamide acetyltransferase family protein [unclassified Sphingobacterium]|uniref:dihydrolipoamide acetyltransferase family protein n=1 Tax=unclassified Sphingobacterium TaxID=2609468 RepID=UPI00105324AE|nr:MULTISPECIES: dihydrolipoamide acetyltransferase family protein [unclassified Sphingobacterium]MCS3556036.1 2-oxoglutarate dehydrogenase E2 component (dihydrolipoamide succinyltransferase) [Sphingobacterium sp. JUb21]TCR00317.1 2-oxoglutarate dehydrogenase E2 component (dihydrolipoamide succinyltransferase) [Sphingobacterium sp. JUb20]
MALYKLLLPKMGESVSEATVTKWLKQPGDTISEDEAILEIATDKVDSDVPSPVKGILKEQLFSIDQVAQVGDIIAIIEIEGDQDGIESPTVDTQSTFEKNQDKIEVTPTTIQIEDKKIEIPGLNQIQPAIENHQSSIHNGIRFYSPLVKNIASHEGLSQQELDQVVGTGSEGRVTKEDILKYVTRKREQTGTHYTSTSAPQPVATVVPEKKEQYAATPVETAHTINSGGDEIIEMDRMRKIIADHMVKSVQTSPHVCSFVEADVTNLVNWRNKAKEVYKKRDGENITFTPIFIEAIAKALKDFPMVNISVDGNHIIKKKNINIGMAAALPNGNLIVPVIKNADQLSLVGLSKSVNDLANRSRANKLKPDDTQGGTFTFTNIGAFGNIMGTPIINQPQAAILAVGTIKKKPAVIETEHGDLIGIRQMMYLSLSYDHRVIDGALGGTFLKRVADYLENWDINREI